MWNTEMLFIVAVIGDGPITYGNWWARYQPVPTDRSRSSYNNVEFNQWVLTLHMMGVSDLDADLIAAV